ncbi:pentapeptide repeat-containing protein [Streptomyces sp. LHD-70]|uniref:pentapeptide repeat-containing protein n=1 Tax=Streptomyces sp. LHD-70 TaxID=3072140 RepID=UPI00280EEA2A|nr:pentapeptide repeat-containing protein [Streptomyces sp. LHD-70]MDQ8702470.1 pentapeptide repeat-containing protein [Streptomyces sp. LHD-70]
MKADCANCFGLCCVALPFAASSDFAADKAAGTPCGNLRTDFGCGIHARLRESGYPGCTVYDCFGAGQQVSQVTFGGRDWRAEPDSSRQMFAVFPVMRHLHELLWYVNEALALPTSRPLRADLRSALDDVRALTRADAETVIAVDVAALRGEINVLLLRASELARAAVPDDKPGRTTDEKQSQKHSRKPSQKTDQKTDRKTGQTSGKTPGKKPRKNKNHRGADLIGARFRQADLRGANLRGALLIAADLAGADLRTADVIGADLRDADLSGADLRGALFLTQAQVNAARGDEHTQLPDTVTRPGHWTA